MDLTNVYDFDEESDRTRAWKLIHKSNPYVIIGFPPCTMCSNLQELNRYMHTNEPERSSKFESELKNARRHIEFCIQLYRHQLRQGRHFLHEHPWGARSWKGRFRASWILLRMDVSWWWRRISVGMGYLLIFRVRTASMNQSRRQLDF